MDSLFLQDVRCFHSKHAARIRPLTLLVGENSSGKSTFLALLRVAWDICALDRPIDFNEEPFSLGAYDQIARYGGGRSGRAKQFVIGLDTSVQSRTNQDGPRLPARLRATFVSIGGQPWVSGLSITCADTHLDLTYQGEKVLTAKLRLGQGAYEIPPEAFGPPAFFRFSLLGYHLSHFALVERRSASPRHLPSREEFQHFASMLSSFVSSLGERPYAFAPIRTRPRRTYDPLKGDPEPEGSHIPMVLARMFSGDKDASKLLKQTLTEFGTSSGLFSDIVVRRMGGKESDPFQVRIKISGPPFNLVDVGYGVSQILPILVDCFREDRNRTFLLQQPEVHLHPRAQAALGTFLGVLAADHGKRFVIETHSDYLIDRIRMDVRDRKGITPEDVSLLYFERRKKGVRIHELELDTFGNICKVPKNYRRFFLTEEKRLLGLG